MIMQLFTQTLRRLYDCGYIETTKEQDTMFAFRIDDGSEANVGINVMPAIHIEQLKALFKGAMNGNTSDMITVSMMYASGYVLEKDHVLASSWASFGLVEQGIVSYEDAIHRLKLDYKRVLGTQRNEYFWPDRIEHTIDAALSKLRSYGKSKDLKGPSIYMPDFSGIKIDLVYKVYRTHNDTWAAHLYAGFVNTSKGKVEYAVTELRHIDGIPIELGVIRNKRTLHNYAPFGEGVKLYVVQGVLTSPKSKRSELKERFPEVRKLSDLWALYMESVNKERETDFSHVERAINNEVAELERKAHKAKDVKKANKIKLKISLLEASKPEAVRLAKIEANKDFPEYLLDFLPTNILAYNRNKVQVPKLKLDMHTHLSSIGFKSLRHPLVKLSGIFYAKPKKSELDNILTTIKEAYSDYTVNGLIIRPDPESVNVRKCYYYKGA